MKSTRENDVAQTGSKLRTTILFGALLFVFFVTAQGRSLYNDNHPTATSDFSLAAKSRELTENLPAPGQIAGETPEPLKLSQWWARLPEFSSIRETLSSFYYAARARSLSVFAIYDTEKPLQIAGPAPSVQVRQSDESAVALPFPGLDDTAESAISAASFESAGSAASFESAGSTASVESAGSAASVENVESTDGTSSANSTTVAATAKASDATYSEPYECLIEPMMLVQLGSETQGLIDEILVDRGEYVKQGQIIARLKSEVETRRVEQARKRASMRSEIDARTADLRLAELVLERAVSLESEQLASSQELDEARALYRVAEAQLQQAQDTQAQFKLDLLLAQALLEQRVVRSPIDGYVVEQHAFAGEFVQDKPVMTVAQLSPLRAEVILPLSEYGMYQAGTLAKITQERGGDVIEGYLQVIDPLIDSGSGTFGIRVHIDNADGKILAGQTCSVSFEEVDDVKLISSFDE